MHVVSTTDSTHTKQVHFWHQPVDFLAFLSKKRKRRKSRKNCLSIYWKGYSEWKKCARELKSTIYWLFYECQQRQKDFSWKVFLFIISKIFTVFVENFVAVTVTIWKRLFFSLIFSFLSCSFFVKKVFFGKKKHNFYGFDFCTKLRIWWRKCVFLQTICI